MIGPIRPFRKNTFKAEKSVTVEAEVWVGALLLTSASLRGDLRRIMTNGRMMSMMMLGAGSTLWNDSERCVCASVFSI